MPSLRRSFTSVLWGGLFPVAAFAAGMTLPPLDGEFSGDLNATVLAGAPKLHWTIALRTPQPDQRVADLVVAGPGTRLTVRAELDATAGDGVWTMPQGELDAAVWFAALAGRFGPAAEGVMAAGRIELSGAGEWRAGVPSGIVKIAWRQGRLHHPVDGWALEGIAAEGSFFVDAADMSVRSEDPFVLTVRTIATSRLGARNLSVRAVLNEAQSLVTSEARIEIAGGTLTAEPAIIPLSPASVDLKLRMTNVGLQDLAALVPAGFSESRGRIDGTLRVSWSEAAGFQVGEGHLELGSTEPAIVRLAATPGFLTERVPEHIELVPAWLGPIARWLRPLNPAFADMRDIELGRAELRVETFEVSLTPEGDGEGRTAHVRLVARPERPDSAVGEVTFEVNVAGPITQVLRMGLNQSFSVETR